MIALRNDVSRHLFNVINDKMTPNEYLGFSGTTEDVLRIWRKNAENWASVTSPWRPSIGDIEIYKKLSGDKVNGRVLILGSTAELRAFVVAENNKPVLVDISWDMLQRMSEFSGISPENEIWVKSDWCEAPLPEDYFDLIVGDMVWWVLSVQNQIGLRDKIVRVLKPDGLFVSRFRLLNMDISSQERLNIIKNSLEALDKNLERWQLIKGAMMSDLYDVTADRKNHRLNRDKTKGVLLDARERINNQIHKEFLQKAADSMLSADWTCQSRDEILSAVEEYFVLVGERRATDYKSEFYPIWSFRKKV